MLRDIGQRLKQWDRALRTSFGDRIDTPGQRALSWLHFELFDHALTRHFWTNFGQVADGVYRSNFPGPARLKRYKRMGIRTIINLRGPAQRAHFLFEQEACEKLGLDLRTVSLNDKSATAAAEFAALFDLFRRAEYPILLHCKSGADRAGLASVLYLMVMEGQPVEQARAELSARYMHVKNSRAGILDHMLDLYTAHNARAPISIEEWIATEYDPQELTESFNQMRAAATA